jgi:hypothetical protein
MSEENAIPIDADAVKAAKNKAVEANIRILENFYSFLISFALTQATLKLILTWQAGENWHALGASILYASFLMTLVPFYQGMNRFLYETHVVRPLDKPDARSSPLLFDIWAFILMASLLFVMGWSIVSPYIFFYAWSALLIVDIVWTTLVWTIQGSRKPIWALNNLLFLGCGWAYWVIIYVLSGFPYFDKNVLSTLIYGFVAFEVARSIMDYKINWNFYFPPEFRGVSNVGK